MEKLLHRISLLRNRYLMALDLLGLLAMPSLALLLRTESIDYLLSLLVPIAIATVLMAALKLGIYHRMGMYAQYWPYAGPAEVMTMIRATVFAALAEIVVAAIVLIPLGILPSGFPRSVLFLDALLSMMFVNSLRISITLLYRLSSPLGISSNLKLVLIVGAGNAGLQVGRELSRNLHLGLKPVGYIDDDQHKIGKQITGIKVLGALADLREILAKITVHEVIIAIPTAPGKVIREVVEACKANGVPSRTIPALMDILRGTAKVEELRSVQLEDLLRRGAVRTDSEQVREVVSGGRVLVTGAGGSIGSEICRQLLDRHPSELILLGHGEGSIYNIFSELKDVPRRKTRVIPVIGDIRDRQRMRQVFDRYRPDIIFHAAAHKHLPLMEDNVVEAVTNNILGTKTLVGLAAAYDSTRFVMISTDKAVNPTSVLGVTKRVAELVVRDTGRQCGKRFVTVRFGNVLGSRGSVVPLFQRQIRTGGPITITHRDVRRFFMTIPEAVQLVLQSASMGYGGEVFVLDMGEQIKILDIARDLIRLNGLEEGKDIEIVFSGLKPGEKVFEELFFDYESVEKTEHEKILVCRNAQPQQFSEDGEAIVPDSILEELALAARDGNANAIYRTLNRVVPEYRPPVDVGEYVTQDEFNYRLFAERSEQLPEERLVDVPVSHRPPP